MDYFNFFKGEKYEYANNSFSDQVVLKLQIWHYKWPSLFNKFLGIDMKYVLLMYCRGHSMVIKFCFFR